MDSKLALLTLHLVSGIGGHSVRQLIKHVGSPEKVFASSSKSLMAIPGFGKSKISLIKDQKNIGLAEKITEACHKKSTKIITIYDDEYPKKLKKCLDAPTVIFQQGNVDLNNDKAIAVVGTRKPSAYGLEQTERIVEGIKQYNPLIISGLAYGIDIKAHTSALTAGLNTVAVLAGGFNHIYPSKHISIAHKITDQGGLITEYPLNEKPEPGKFPARNRIIAGLSDAVIVIEAAAKGGALITAEMANTYHREVFAIPGNNDKINSTGCNLLIRNHKAHILTKPEDIPYIMGWQKTDSKPEIPIPDLENEEFRVWKVLSEGKDFMIDDISILTNIPSSELANTLLSLEFKGIVKSLPGKRYKISA